jgi:hypothetical protein
MALISLPFTTFIALFFKAKRPMFLLSTLWGNLGPTCTTVLDLELEPPSSSPLSLALDRKWRKEKGGVLRYWLEGEVTTDDIAYYIQV